MDQPQNQPTNQPSASSAPAPKAPLSEADKKDMQENKLMAVIAYFSLLFLVPLLFARQSKYAQFHAKQGLVLFVAGFLLNIVGMAVRAAALTNLVCIIASIYFAVQAWNGSYEEIPYIGQYAKKINL